VITLVATGTCTINANQAGDSTFAAASTVSQSFTVTAAVYTIGNTGPGGGLIFLISDDLRYEMAPKTWGAIETAGIRWCSDTTNSVTTGLTVGTGSTNTTAMLTDATPFVACTTSAPNAVRDYSPVVSGVTINDWFLPSQDELNAMCNYSRNPTTPPTDTCTGTQNGAFAGGAFGFDASYYWSSSQSGDGSAWAQLFSSGIQFTGTFKGQNRLVRPVRAF
jgi:hypothetical protein